LFNLLDLPKQLVKIPTFEQDEPMYQHSWNFLHRVARISTQIY
jgi:hypothetical protein